MKKKLLCAFAAAVMSLALLTSAFALTCTGEEYRTASASMCETLLGLTGAWDGNTYTADGITPFDTEENADGTLKAVSAAVTVDPSDTETMSATLQQYGLTLAAMVYSWRYTELGCDMDALTAEAETLTADLSAISNLGTAMTDDGTGLAQSMELPVAGAMLRIGFRIDSESGLMTWEAALTAE